LHVYVARMAVKELTPTGSEEIGGAVGLEAYVASSNKETFMLKTYRILFKGLLLQDPGSGDLILLKPGDRLVIRRATEQRCRWHPAPLNSEDDPLTRKYCLKRASTGLGYCREHANSLRAVYDACFSASGIQSREACLWLDRALGGQLSYAVYIADYGGRRLKVGSTRLFRWVDRIAEQPHLAAALVHVTRSAVDARSTERTIASGREFSEIPSRNRLRLAMHSLKLEAAKRVARAAKMLSARGYMWNKEIVRIELPENFQNAVETRPEKLDASRLEIRGYWGGYLLLEDEGSGKHLIALRRLLHANSVAVPV